MGGRPIGTAIEAGGDGDFGRTVPLSVTFADDVAAAVVAAVAAASDAEGAAALAGARLHLCAEETPTWAELVTGLAEELRAQGVFPIIYAYVSVWPVPRHRLEIVLADMCMHSPAD